MKAAFRFMMASLLFVGAASQINAQAPPVAHNTWTSGAPLPTAVSSAASAVLKNEIYVVGGSGSTENLADVQIFNPATNSWSSGPSYPISVGGASAAVVKNILYVFGGTADGITASNAVWAYNPKTKAWTPMADMPTARWDTAAAVEKKTNIIYVTGGVVSDSNFI